MEVSWNRGTPQSSIEIGFFLQTRDPPFMETTISRYDCLFFFLRHILLTSSLRCGFTYAWVTCSSKLSGHPSSSIFTIFLLNVIPGKHPQWCTVQTLLCHVASCHILALPTLTCGSRPDGQKRAIAALAWHTVLRAAHCVFNWLTASRG